MAEQIANAGDGLDICFETFGDEGVRVLDHLEIDHAHVVGVSMGGMIAQTMAARHPGRVLSLASIMSNTGHRWRGTPGLRAYPIFLRRPPRDLDAAGAGRQLAAIIAAGDRTAEVATITAPTVVIHGTRDVMVRPSGGRATARAIEGAELVMLEGMGHDLPRDLWDRILGLVEANAARARTRHAAA